MFKKTAVAALACLFVMAGLVVPSEAFAEVYEVVVVDTFDDPVEGVLIDFYFDEENNGTRVTDEFGIASFEIDDFEEPLWYAYLWTMYVPIEPDTWFQNAPPEDPVINWIIEEP